MKFLLVIASVIAVTHSQNPVLLWPADDFAVPTGQSALDSMKVEDFKKLIGVKRIIVFHKKEFSLEEVSYPKKPLPYLQSVDAIALQDVQSILDFVGGLNSSDNLKVVRLSDGPLDKEEKKIKNTILSNPGFAAILVGSGSRRSLRDTIAVSSGPACTSKADDICLAYVGVVQLTKDKSDPQNLSCQVTCTDKIGLTIKIGDTELIVRNDSRSGGYNLSVTGSYQIDSETTWAPDGFSYSCMELRLIPRPNVDDKSTISLKRVQLYPGQNFHSSNNTFPESYDCSTWFTPAILMGMVTGSFLIFILFGAVVCLLDIKTNDRFDDPKKKTISVNISE